ncbi:hypothetical protein SKA34_01392 [Photobacterium sp. SKA34]|nr:hypothetical protein SKA34_01392 [Photobacterium sp. SKA34]
MTSEKYFFQKKEDKGKHKKFYRKKTALKKDKNQT